MLPESSSQSPTIAEKIAEYISVNVFKVGPNRRLQNVLKSKVCSSKTVSQRIIPLSFFRNDKDLEIMLSQMEEKELSYYLSIALAQELGGKPSDYNVILDKSQ